VSVSLLVEALGFIRGKNLYVMNIGFGRAVNGPFSFVITSKARALFSGPSHEPRPDPKSARGEETAIFAPHTKSSSLAALVMTNRQELSSAPRLLR
jgi:hypothetical protein